MYSEVDSYGEELREQGGNIGFQAHLISDVSRLIHYALLANKPSTLYVHFVHPITPVYYTLTLARIGA